MHAGWLLDEFERTAVWASVENFLGWLGGEPRLTARYADAIGARTEPMLHAGFLTDSVLREAVVGRMALLRARHKSAGRQTSWSEDTREAWRRVDRYVKTQIFGYPGPLEGDRTPVRLLPEGLVDAACQAFADHEDASRLRILAMFSQGATPDDTELAAARTAVTKIGGNTVGDDEINELNCASSVAVACRDIALGDEVAKALIRLSSHAPDSEIIHQMVLVMVQTAGVHSTRHLWSEWLERRLRSFAEHLPGPPSGALRTFLESLRELQVVLPVEEWFHLRAQAVARAGAG